MGIFNQWWTGMRQRHKKSTGTPPAQNQRAHRIAGRAGAKASPYTHRDGSAQRGPVREESPVLPLYSPEQLDTVIKELRTVLARDDTPECRRAIVGDMGNQIRSLCKLWYQRIDYPQYGLASTSDRSVVHIDQGSINRLGQRLTSEEACILRPLPKWYYIKPLLPPVAGKTVLELGSSHGFFSFRFAEMGARKVTGLEIKKDSCQSAIWSAKMLNHSNVEFLHADFLLDLNIPAHDIIFLSAVHNHFLFPFYGLLRMVNLAREFLIWDGTVQPEPHQAISLATAWRENDGTLIYHSFHLSEAMILDFLDLIGVPPANVTRYRAPDEPQHVLFVIRTAGLAEARKARNYPEYLERALTLDFRGKE